MSILEWIGSLFSRRQPSCHDALNLSFSSLDRWLESDETTRQFAFLQMFSEVPTLLNEFRDEYRADIQQVFLATSPADQKIRLRELTLVRAQSLVLNRAFRSRTDTDRRVLAAQLIAPGTPFEEADAISAALVARTECTLMLARQLQKKFFRDVAPHDYFGPFVEAQNLYVDAVFDATLKKHAGTDASVEARMIQPLQQMLDQIRAEARTGRDRRYPPRPHDGAA